MKLSASKAAKETGRSVPTITRAIKSGKLSASPVEGGGWEIDPAELFRVFPAVTANRNETPTTLEPETPIHDRALQVELEVIRERLRMTENERERERKDAADQIEDLRRRLDAEGEERRKLTALITHKPETPAPAPAVAPQPAGLLQRLFGRSLT